MSQTSDSVPAPGLPARFARRLMAHPIMLAAAAWTLVIGALLLWHWRYDLRHNPEAIAVLQARAAFDRDQALRRWASMHGGVYVPLKGNAQPSPYLAHLRERDVVTASGRVLTLLDPATMMREIGKQYGSLFGITGRVTGVNPLNPANAPDAWERGALEAFARGATQVEATVESGGAPYLRMMRPMRAEKSCITCHKQQGFKAGEIAGGVGVSVPLSGIIAESLADFRTELGHYGAIWILGLGGIGAAGRWLRRYGEERKEAQRRTQRSAQEMAIVNSLMQTALGQDAIEVKLANALDAILATSWLRLQQRGAIFLADVRTRTLSMAVQRNLNEEIVRKCAHLPFGKCLCGRAAADRSLLFSPDVDERHEITFEGMQPHGHYIVPILSDGGLLGVLSLYIDANHQPAPGELRFLNLVTNTLAGVIERHHAEAARRVSEERYALAAAGANDGLWDWDVTAGRVYYSPRWKAMLGLSEEEVTANPEEWLGRAHPEERDLLRSALQAHWVGGTAHFEHEHRLQHRDSSYLWVLARGLAVRDDSGGVVRMAGSLTDITERKRAESQALHDALHDGLTGLPNRVLFVDRLQRILERAQRREAHPFAVLFLDLDRFKTLNDSLGHLIGDRLLIEAAARLRQCLRQQDTIARFGGDEFAILLEELEGPSTANWLVERIHAAFAEPFKIQSHEIYTSVSIGITLSGDAQRSAEELLRDADTAMYRAKGLGRGRYVLFDESMHAHAVSVLALENDLRRGLARGEILVHYQPIVALVDGSLAGLEALARWQHPERGLLTPGEFMAVAEDSGLVAALDMLVLREACTQLREWQERFGSNAPGWMSVNLSARTLSRAGLRADIATSLRISGLDPHTLSLEITESAMMEDTELAARVLADLSALGIRVCVDDFGIGHSSLAYLHRFPISTLKVDRSFIGEGGDKLSNPAIVKTAIALAEHLAIDVVAEGVETAEQHEQLATLGCRYVQGYLFGAAQPAEHIGKLIASGHRWQERRHCR